MAGYDPNEPRDEKGQWTDYGGRPAANYKIARADYGKPRVSIQYASSFNPSDPRGQKDALAAEAKRLKEAGYKNVSSGNLSNAAKQRIKAERFLKQASASGPGGINKALEKAADKILESQQKVIAGKASKVFDPLSKITGKPFQNLDEGTRRNYNIGPAPWGMSEPSTGEYKSVLAAQEAHRKAMMKVQADQRKTRDAMVDRILKEPGAVHYYQIGNRRAEAMQPSQKTRRRMISAERIFNKIWHWTGGDLKD